jgi:hypothetical protein
VIGYGAQLAVDLLEDELAMNLPVFRRSLVDLAMSQLQRWPDLELKRLSGQLLPIINGDDRTSSDLVREALTQAFASSGRSRVAACAVLRDWAKVPGAGGILSRKLLAADTSWRPINDAARSRVHTTLAVTLDEVAVDADLGGAEIETLKAARSELNTVETLDMTTPAESIAFGRTNQPLLLRSRIAMLFEQHDLAAVLVKLMLAAPIERACAAIFLRKALIATDERGPRAHHPSVASALSSHWSKS